MSVTDVRPTKKDLPVVSMPEGHPRWKEIDEKLATDDVARVVERQVNQLDRELVDPMYCGIGRTPFDPVILLKMVLFDTRPARRGRSQRRSAGSRAGQ